MLVWVEEAFAARCFWNWKGEKASPDMPMLLARVSWLR